jgi:hypothetical protein
LSGSIFIWRAHKNPVRPALHYFLSKHPNIRMGDQEEIHFFDDDAMFVSQVDYEPLPRHYPRLPPSSIAGDCNALVYIYYEPAAERIWMYNPKNQTARSLAQPR